MYVNFKLESMGNSPHILLGSPEGRAALHNSVRLRRARDPNPSGRNDRFPLWEARRVPSRNVGPASVARDRGGRFGAHDDSRQSERSRKRADAKIGQVGKEATQRPDEPSGLAGQTDFPRDWIDQREGKESLGIFVSYGRVSWSYHGRNSSKIFFLKFCRFEGYGKFRIYIVFPLFLQYSVVYYEKDGDEVVQHRSQPDVVTLPDYEILQVRRIGKRERFIE